MIVLLCLDQHQGLQELVGIQGIFRAKILEDAGCHSSQIFAKGESGGGGYRLQ